MNPLELLASRCRALDVRMVRDVRKICELGSDRVRPVDAQVLHRAIVEKCLVQIVCNDGEVFVSHWDINTAIAQALGALDVREGVAGTQVYP